MDRVKGKVAIITGAASGIGRATALLMAKEGAKVVIGDINEVGGKKVAEEIKHDGGEAIFVKQDVRVERDWAGIIKKTLAEFGKLDILVNDAGVFIVKTIEDTTLEEWHSQMSVHADATFLGTKYAIGAMKKSGGGSIVNISSVAAMVGGKDTSAYSASKGAVRSFTKAAAIECSKAGYNYNIRVNSVHPSGILTPMAAAAFVDENVRKWSESLHPIGRMAEPIEVAKGILYLASDDSNHVTGAELVIDGGLTAR